MAHFNMIGKVAMERPLFAHSRLSSEGFGDFVDASESSLGSLVSARGCLESLPWVLSAPFGVTCAGDDEQFSGHPPSCADADRLQSVYRGDVG